VSFADIRCRDLTQINNHSLGFAEAMSASTIQEPVDRKHDLGAITVDLTNTRLGSDLSTTPNTTSRRDFVHASSASPKYTQNGAPDPPLERTDSPQTESESIHRARYAANQRHSKASNSQRAGHNIGDASEANTQADGKKQRLREKNKVAATKCRQRQRRQAENVRVKVRGLSATNAQLKSYAQELRQELNGLRVCALGHADCDYKLAQYNQGQVERLAAGYYSSFGGHGGTVIARKQDGFQVQRLYSA
jgi:hypothetical protein